MSRKKKGARKRKAPSREPEASSSTEAGGDRGSSPEAHGRDPSVRPVPAGRWLAPVLGGLVVFLLGGSAAEAAWRSQGQRPTVDPEDLDLWAAERLRASNGSEKVIVLIGKSRAQLDLDVPTFQRRYPDHDIVQLAVKGQAAFTTYRDLVRDDDFRGRILFALTEPDLALDNDLAQQREVDRAKTIGPDALWNARLRAWVDAHVVVRSHLLFPGRVLENLSKGQLPAINFVVTERDRFTHADFSRADLEVVAGDIFKRQDRLYRLMGDMQTPNYPWLDEMLRAAPLAFELTKKGGNVAFVHLPVSGRSLAFSERFYPKRRFWDHFSSTVKGRAVHFREVASLSGYTCPDTSHLDEKDAVRFTQALLAELERRGLFPKGTGPW